MLSRDANEPAIAAAVDAGSNAIRLEIVAIDAAGAAAAVESARAPVRLGRGVFTSGHLDAGAMDLAAAALLQFRGTMERRNVTLSRCVATSAVREARNRDAFLDLVWKIAGLRLEVISGAEEARLLAVAAGRRMLLKAGRAALADVGGGSAQVAVVENGAAAFARSYPLGGVRLYERFLDDASPPAQKRAEIEAYIAERLADDLQQILGGGIVSFIAAGGNARALARIAGAEGDAPFVDKGRLRGIADRLSAMNAGERARAFALRADRVDAIVPAALLLNYLIDAFDAAGFHAPRVSVRDGILIELGVRAAVPRPNVNVFHEYS